MDTLENVKEIEPKLDELAAEWILEQKQGKASLRNVICFIQPHFTHPIKKFCTCLLYTSQMFQQTGGNSRRMQVGKQFACQTGRHGEILPAHRQGGGTAGDTGFISHGTGHSPGTYAVSYTHLIPIPTASPWESF